MLGLLFVFLSRAIWATRQCVVHGKRSKWPCYSRSRSIVTFGFGRVSDLMQIPKEGNHAWNGWLRYYVEHARN